MAGSTLFSALALLIAIAVAGGLFARRALFLPGSSARASRSTVRRTSRSASETRRRSCSGSGSSCSGSALASCTHSSSGASSFSSRRSSWPSSRSSIASRRFPPGRRWAGSEPGLVRAARGSLRRPRPPGGRGGVLDPQSATAGALGRLPPRRGRPHPRADRGDRDDAPALARHADRAWPQPVAVRLVTRLRCARWPLRRRCDDRGARARLRVGPRSDHPRLPHLPAALEAPAHRDRGDQRLLLADTCSRPSGAARLRIRGRGGAALRRRHRRRPDVEADARLDVVHGVRALPGRLSRVRHRQRALSEATDHGHPGSPLRRGAGRTRGRSPLPARPERGHGGGRLGLRDLRRVRT